MLKFDPATHTYTWDDKPLVSVTQVLQGVGLIDFTVIPPDILEAARLLGQAVHQATHYDDMGDLDEDRLDPNLKGYLEAWRSFRGHVQWNYIERPFYHPTYQFAGTPDRIGTTFNELTEYSTIVDIKTGSTVPAWTGLQLAGYAILADLPTARRLAVQLKPDGTYQIHPFTERSDRGVFLAALTTYNWKENHK